MPQHTYLEQGLTLLETRFKGPPSPLAAAAARPFITLSRETSAGATTVGQLLVPMLDEALGEAGQPWIFLDKNLLAHALVQLNLPERLARHLPEDRVSEIKGVIGEFMGMHPPLWELEHQVLEAILHLAQVGRAIFVGRASFMVTKSLPAGFHVRLIASPEVRIRRTMALLQCDEAAAKDHIQRTDRGRERYLKARFGTDPDEPHLYDLVINTDRITPKTTARIIVSSLCDRLAGLESTPPFPVPAPGAAPAAAGRAG
ncbi:MAG TPA: cytidylate kinase-like family protein [Opitutaceae bacterium]|nr:cytidylate kinase-like family protein [Opitutaceae bacterium]